MHVGMLVETRPWERRVALTPSGAQTLQRLGAQVWIERGAGDGAGFTDQEYMATGAELCDDPSEVVTQAQLLVKVQAPHGPELAMLHDRQILLCFLHYTTASADLRDTLTHKGITAIALELLADDDGTRRIVEPQAEIGGRVAIAIGAERFLVTHGGAGHLLGGAPGVPPLSVVVLGAGTAGKAAARQAQRLGASVTLLDRDPVRLMRVGPALDGIPTAVANDYLLARYLEQADLLVGAVGDRGHAAPRVLTRDHVRMMRAGSVFIDLSIDAGGCSETSRPTTPDEPEYVEEGVRHVCIPNLPATVSATASRSLANALLPTLQLLVERGVDGACEADPAMLRGCVVGRGVVRG